MRVDHLTWHKAGSPTMPHPPPCPWVCRVPSLGIRYLSHCINQSRNNSVEKKVELSWSCATFCFFFNYFLNRRAATVYVIVPCRLCLYYFTYKFLLYLSTMYGVLFISKFILCQLGVIFLCMCCRLVWRNRYAHWFTVLTIHFLFIFLNTTIKVSLDACIVNRGDLNDLQVVSISLRKTMYRTNTKNVNISRF